MIKNIVKWRCERGHFISRCNFINSGMYVFYVNSKI